MQQKNSKKFHVKSVAIQIHSHKFYPNKVNILFVIKFRNNFFIINFKLYNEILVRTLVNLIV
jgi:hypothetical protein